MKHSNKLFTESTLDTNLNELAQALVRDLSMACRKVAIYGPSHPMSSKAVEKPFFSLDKLFAFEKSVLFGIERGHLFVSNIRLKESVFTEEIVRYMQVLGVDVMFFRQQITMTELARFLDRFVKRVSRTDQSQVLSTYLKRSGIDTIEINSELAFNLFENGVRLRGDVEGDFSVRNIALRQLGDSPLRLAQIMDGGEDGLETQSIDFSYDIVQYLMPEKVTTLDPDKIKKEIVATLEKLRSTTSDSEQAAEVRKRYRSLKKLLDFHPQRDQITTQIEDSIGDNRFMADVSQEGGDPVSAIKFESRDQIDRVLRECLSNDSVPLTTQELVDAFARLMRTGQKGKAAETIEFLMDLLGSTDMRERGRSLDLLIALVDSIPVQSDSTVFENMILRMGTVLNSGAESFEYSELIWRAMDKCIISRRYDLLARLATMVGARRRVEGGVIVYDSIVVKIIIQNMNRPEVISALIDDLIAGNSETTGHIRDTLIAIGDEQAAVGLSRIISHPARHIRQLTLRILAELGRATLNVFSGILADDSLFERDSNRHELPDVKWYVIRNSIFILGLLEDQEGVTPLRLRIGDPDVRVRREIVSTLEKIGGEDACDMLTLMAEDADKQIRESAVVAVGLIGTEDFAPMLIDAMRRQPAIAVRGVTSLGRIGGEGSREFLSRLLKDEELLAEMAEGGASRDELRLAIVAALGRIGDSASIDRLREFESSMSVAQRMLRQSSLHKAVTEILSRH
ncbi:MAG: HEAT repeat domain-containing protein [candidate division Zixibacteria bacterium]|nr:HEAT repeat domain-containing protein [candidate division Zixibacteria bacterium]